MIIGRLTAKAQTTIPRAVRLALGLEPGDDVMWEIEDDRVILSRAAKTAHAFTNNFDEFSEWNSKADCIAFDND
jgi:antitoxin PrlF